MKSTQNNFVLKVFVGGKEITLDKATAKKYVKLGIDAEKHKEVLDILKHLAKREKVSVLQFCKDLKSSKNKSLVEEISQKIGGDEELAQKLIDYEDFQSDNLYPTQKDEKDEILKNFPEYKDFDDIPSQVFIISETQGISLFDALLRYRFMVENRIEKEKLNRTKNKQGAVGSLRTTDDYEMSYISALLKAINN